MSKIKLSVVPGEIKKTGWDSYSQFDENGIKKIVVNDSKGEKSLNAIPSPLSRMHLFDAAFSMVGQDEKVGASRAGKAYNKIVSDCLDVFELVYNWNSHIRSGKLLKFEFWNRDEQTTKLQSAFKKKEEKIKNDLKLDNDNGDKKIKLQDLKEFKHYLVGKTLNVYLKQESFEKYHFFGIIKLDKKVIAGTSPLTGFFTTPNNITDLDLINPITEKKYFSKIRSFKERDENVKKFIADFFHSRNNNGDSVFGSNLAIREYLDIEVNRVGESVSPNLEDIYPNSISLFNDTIKLKSKKERDSADYFENHLVRINYRINDERFYLPKNEKHDRKHDYLLPFTKLFFEDFRPADVSSVVTINEKDSKTVEVSIKRANQKPLVKTYQLEDTTNPLYGEIIDISGTHEINFCLAVYPNIVVSGSEMNSRDNGEGNNNSSETAGSQDDLNNYYKVMLAMKKGKSSDLMKNSDFQLSFYSNNEEIKENAPNINFSRFNRTDLYQNPYGSTYFQINGTYFDFSLISIKLPDSEKIIKCAFAPIWTKKQKLGPKKFKYAIDFGTTTTFIGYTEASSTAIPKPFSILSNNELLVSLFNKSPRILTNEKNKVAYDYDSFDNFKEFITLEIKEFLPVVIGTGSDKLNSKFSFPIRTALCEMDEIDVNNYVSLSNANIAFGFEKVTMIDSHQSFKTNLKWSTDTSTEKRIFVFLEELIKLIKYKVISDGGNPSTTDIVWFSPLSFGESNREIFGRIWKNLFENDLKSTGALTNMSESEAPFYFHFRTADAQKTDSVLSIDIGGGSTDIVCFEKAVPKIGSSFNFAANLLWSEGNNEFTNARNNGIFLTFVDTINNRLQQKSLGESDKRKQDEYQKINQLNTNYLDNVDKFGSDDIINFWISNDSKTEFTSELTKSDFKVNFLFFFSSIIYHSAQLLKTSGLAKPLCICISGNGSKVIDLITTDKEKLSAISKYLIEAVYGNKDGGYTPQLIIPNSSERKEATCFGGLFKWGNMIPKSKSYIGFKSADYTKFSNVSKYKDIASDLENSVKDNIKEFIDIFINMDSVIKFESLGIKMQSTALKNFLVDSVSGNFSHAAMKKKIKTTSDQDINDSLFFWPLKGLLFDLSTLNSKVLEKYKAKTLLFVNSLNERGEVEESKLSAQKTNSSMFRIEFEKESQNGSISFETDDEFNTKLALSNIETYLLPGCYYSRLPDKNTVGIRILVPGTVEKVNDVWVVKEKMQIEFI